MPQVAQNRDVAKTLTHPIRVEDSQNPTANTNTMGNIEKKIVMPTITIGNEAKSDMTEVRIGKIATKETIDAQRKLNMAAKKERKSWANLFTGNRFAAKGMDLEYIAPLIQDGVKVVQLQKEEVEAENDK